MNLKPASSSDVVVRKLGSFATHNLRRSTTLPSLKTVHLGFRSPAILWFLCYMLKTTIEQHRVHLKCTAQKFCCAVCRMFWLVTSGQSTELLHFNKYTRQAWRHRCHLVYLAILLVSKSRGVFFCNQAWCTVLRSIATTMAKRWSLWASSSFLLMENTVRSGKRKSVAWTGNRTSTRGCVRPILNRIASCTTTNFMTHLACQDRRKQLWSTMRFQPSLIMKTGRLNQQMSKSCRVNENTRIRMAKCLGKEERCSRYCSLFVSRFYRVSAGFVHSLHHIIFLSSFFSDLSYTLWIKEVILVCEFINNQNVFIRKCYLSLDSLS